MAQQDGTPGKAPNQFAQVGMGGSQGGGQFEQGENQSGSLQDGQRGTTARAARVGGTIGDQEEQEQLREQRTPDPRPDARNEDDASGSGRDSSGI